MVGKHRTHPSREIPMREGYGVCIWDYHSRLFLHLIYNFCKEHWKHLEKTLEFFYLIFLSCTNSYYPTKLIFQLIRNISVVASSMDRQTTGPWWREGPALTSSASSSSSSSSHAGWLWPPWLSSLSAELISSILLTPWWDGDILRSHSTVDSLSVITTVISMTRSRSSETVMTVMAGSAVRGGRHGQQASLAPVWPHGLSGPCSPHVGMPHTSGTPLSILYTLYSTLHSLHSTLYSLLSTFYNVLTLYTPHSTKYWHSTSLHSTLHILQCTDTLHSTLHILQLTWHNTH